MQVMVTASGISRTAALRHGSAEKIVMYVGSPSAVDVLGVGDLLDREQLDVADRAQRRGEHRRRLAARRCRRRAAGCRECSRERWTGRRKS